MISLPKTVRRNSRKSVHHGTRKHRCTGPRTPEGKARSSVNAFKHGLCSDRPIFPGESSKLFDMFRRTMFRLLYPKNLLQADFVNRIVSSIWRLRRSALIEDQIFAYAEKKLLSSPNVDKDTILGQSWLMYDQNITRLRRYQVSIERTLMAMLTKYTQFCTVDDRDHNEDKNAQIVGFIDALKFYQKTTANSSTMDVDGIVDVCMKAVASVQAWDESFARAEAEWRASKSRTVHSTQSYPAEAEESSESDFEDSPQPASTQSPEPSQSDVADSAQPVPAPTPPPAPVPTPSADASSTPRDSSTPNPVPTSAPSSNPLPDKDLQPASDAAPAEGVRSVIAPQTNSLNGGSA